MWKHLPPFGNRRTTDRRANTHDRSARSRANTVHLPPNDLKQDSSRPPPSRVFSTDSVTRPGASPTPVTRTVMTTATVDDVGNGPLPPTKASLKTWWNHFAFAQKAKREVEEKKGAS